MLEDDRSAFPAYEACIVVRRARIEGNPAPSVALSELSGKFDSKTMRTLNYAVAVEHKHVAEPTAEFLRKSVR